MLALSCPWAKNSLDQNDYAAWWLRRIDIRYWRSTICLAVTVLLPACYSWDIAEVSPRVFIEEQRPEYVRVQMRDGPKISFENPEISSDTIVGFTGEGSGQLALSEITELEIRRFSGVKTGGFVTLQFSLLSAFLAVVIYAQPHYRGL